MVDGWINPNPGIDGLAPDVAQDLGNLFPGLRARLERGTTLSQLLDEMDAAGVSKAVLTAAYQRPADLVWMEAAIEAHPDRFAGSLLLDPHTGMQAVRRLEAAVRDGGVRLARLAAFLTQRPYDDAVYYPLYSKCAELGIPVSVNVGLPGPRVPGRHQDPMSLDEVCAFFPELHIVMSHGGEPWADMCVKLMTKWPNLSYMSSAYAPRHIPEAVVAFANGRGAGRVMWATDYPVLDFARCRTDIAELPFRDETRRRQFAGENATRLFFGSAGA